MSATIDERVVEMRFDNKQFENGVKESLSTLDKLKQALNLSDSAKGLENVQKAADGLNVSGVGKAVDQVKEKFSALEAVAFGALARIGQQAIDAGEKIVRSLTIEPVSQGFSEYELKMGSVQTILASTGESLDTVNRYLDELNTYADKTIYSFSDMTSSIGKFTNAGVSLKDAVKAIQGISNEAAVSGANANEASRAMYNFAQALSAGAVKLIDWKSIENANMATVEFKQTLLDTAVAMGTVVKVGDEYQTTTTDANGHVSDLFTSTSKFNESLSAQWMTTEVLVQTLGNYSTDIRTLTEAEKEAYEEKLRGIGYTEEQIRSIEELGQKAFDSAQDVKTFSQLMDTLKEAAGSGWAQTWELMIGDFEKAKERITELSDVFSKIISSSAESRNKVLEGAFTSKWDVLIEKLNKAGVETETFQNKVSELAKSHNVDLGKMIEEEGSFEKALRKAFNSDILDKSILKDAINSFVGTITDATESTEEMAVSMEEYGEIVDKVIRGDFGNGEERIKALTEAGYDYATVQDLVNEKLGSSVRHLSSLTEEQLKNADSLAKLSDEELKNSGYTEEQIVALRDLQKEANTAGSSIDELINDLGKPSGAELVWDSVLNVIHSVIDALSAVKKAWNDVFHAGMSEDEILAERSEKLYNLITAINSFTEKLKVNDEVADKITRTFKGLYSILDIIRTVVSGGVSLAFKIVSGVLGEFDLDILDVTANIGDLLVRFHDFILGNERIEKAVRLAAAGIRTVIETIKNWVYSFKQIPEVQANISNLGAAFSNTIGDIKEYLGDGMDRIKAFIDRVKAIDGITLDNIGNILEDFKDNVIDYFLNIGGRFDKLSNAIQKFKDSVKEYFSNVSESLEGVKKKLFDFITSVREKFSSNIGIGEILTVGIGAGIVLFVKKIGDALELLSRPLDAITGVFSKFDDILKAIVKNIKANTLKAKSEALKNIAISIGILAVALMALTKVDQKTLWSSVGALGALAAELLAVSAAMGAVSKIGGGKGSASMLGISASLLILVKSLKCLEELDRDKLGEDLAILGIMATGLAIIAGQLAKKAPQLSKGALTFIGIAASLKIMASALADIDKLQLTNVLQTFGILLASVIALGAIASASKGVKFSTGIGLLSMVLSLKLFIGVLDDITNNVDPAALEAGIGSIIGVFTVLAALMLSTRLAGKNAAKAGVEILAISAALLIMSASLKVIATMDTGELKQSIAAVSILLTLFSAVVALSHFAGKNAAKAGAMLLLMSGALVILSGVIVVLSHINPDGLGQALAAVSTLMLVFTAIIAATHLAKDCKGTITIIAVTIGLLAIALGALSMINPDNLLTATEAMSRVMAMFSLIVASTGLAQKANGTLIILSGVILVLGGVLAVLSKLPIDSTLVIAGSLSMLMLSLSASLLIISHAGTIARDTYGALTALTAVTAALAIILGVLASLNVGPTLEIAASLSVLLLSLSSACLILSNVSSVSSGAIKALEELTILVGLIGGVLGVIGGLTSYIPEIETFLDKGISLLEKLGAGIGGFVGSIVSGFLTSAVSGLPSIAATLSAFMINLGPFILGAKTINSEVLEGVKALAETILLLSAVDFVNGISSLFPWAPSLADIATQLTGFGEGITKFVQSIDSITPDSIDKAATAAQIFADLSSAIPKTSGGIFGLFSGTTDMGEFGDQLVEFGEGLKSFIDSIQGLDTTAQSQADIAAQIAERMSQMVESMPETSAGIFGLFTGSTKMDEFGEQLSAFGDGLMKFTDSVKDLDDTSLTQADFAAQIAERMSQMVESMPETSGGIFGLFSGTTNMGTFGEQLSDFGAGLMDFVNSVKDLNGTSLTKANFAARIAERMSQMVESMPETSGGIFGLFSGTTDMGTFGKQLSDFGAGLMDFVNSVKDLNGTSLSQADFAAKIAERMSQMVANISDGDTSKSSKFFGLFGGETKMETVGDELANFGNGIKKFADSVSEIDSADLAAVITQTERLIEMLKGMAGLDTNSVGNFTAAITDLGNVGLDGFIEVFNSADTKVYGAVSNMLNAFINAANAQKSSLTAVFASLIEEILTAINSKQPLFVTAGNTLMVRFITGVKSQDASAKNVFTNIINGCLIAIRNKYSEFETAGQQCMVKMISGIQSKNTAIQNTITSNLRSVTSAIRNHYTDFYSAGSYLVDGFCAGISESNYKAEAMARAMAGAAANAAAQELDEHSPSKVGYRIGDYFGAAFVNAIGDYKGRSYAAGSEMANFAKTGLSRAVSKIAEIVEDGIDPNPTITPVLDLSNVEKEAKTVSSLFGGLNISASYDQALNTESGFIDRALVTEGAVSDLVSRMERSSIAGNDDVVNTLNQLRGDVSELSSVLGKLKIVMDTGAVVGALSPEIDLALGKVSEFRKRRM